MSILDRVGNVARGLGDVEKMTKVGTVVAGVAAAAGFMSAHPFKPEIEGFQDAVYGDPHAIKKSFNAEVMTDLTDNWDSYWGNIRTDQLRSPTKNPKNFSPPGALVLGMYNSRLGGS